MTHPYFTAKARAWMARAGGRPQDATDLARWAQIAREAGLTDHGVVIGKDGTLLAETRLLRGMVSARYVDADDMARLGLVGQSNELGLAMRAIRLQYNQPVAHAAYWEVCTGAGQYIPDVDDACVVRG